jgi:hypothetical protein
MSMDVDEAAASAPQKRKIGRPRNSDKGKERATPVKAHATLRKEERDVPIVASKKGKEKAGDKVTITGPAGRERKRSIKNDQAERRRQRDAKFDADTGNYGAVSPPLPDHHIVHLTAYKSIESTSGRCAGLTDSHQANASSTMVMTPHPHTAMTSLTTTATWLVINRASLVASEMRQRMRVTICCLRLLQGTRLKISHTALATTIMISSGMR